MTETSKRIKEYTYTYIHMLTYPQAHYTHVYVQTYSFTYLYRHYMIDRRLPTCPFTNNQTHTFTHTHTQIQTHPPTHILTYA
uniref:Uncharacterized protein n=1 Tax=Octopus bimaculoides TaxID=37653 RepID=A0A0L8I5S0_OCTBM